MVRRIAETLKAGDRVVIASHVNPEADAIGSSMALGMALEALGKEIYVYNASGTPRNLKSFPGAGGISTQLPSWKPDILLVVDCGDFDRIGREAVEALSNTPIIINVDHHSTNDGFGHLKWVEPQSSSTGEMAVHLIEELGVKFTPEMATWILAAIVADTGSFQFSNAGPDTFCTAGKMVGLGARPEEVARGLFGNLPEGNLKLLAMVLATLEIDRKLKVALTRVTLDMFRDTGAGSDAVEGFVEYARALEGVEVAALFRENESGGYKVSLRSKGAADVAAVAHAFGGGGHEQAAGYTMEGNFDHVKQKLLEALKDAAGGA